MATRVTLSHTFQRAMQVFMFLVMLNATTTTSHYHRLRINQYDHAIKTYKPVRTEGQIRAVNGVRSKLFSYFLSIRIFSLGLLNRCIARNLDGAEECYQSVFNSDYFWS